ncbi:MAG: polysaccharide deacetylase family protein, partial [Gammaproteobacteria bacterium]|nr:polysaccharide deacetylase family protein [Gammaproteobacteria bacterium]
TTSLIGTEEWFWPDKVKYLLNNISFKSEYHSIQIKNENIFKLIFDCIEKLKIATVEGRIKLEDELINKLKECEIEKIHSTLAEIFKLVKISLPIDRVLLNWDEVRTMSNKNITFGSHTCNHKILTILNEDEIKKELKDSKDKLKYEKVSFTPVFCYPNGNYNNIVQKLVKDAGYSAAVTTKFGAIEIATLDKYSLNRIGIHNDVSLSAMLFSFHLSGIWQRLKYKSKR